MIGNRTSASETIGGVSLVKAYTAKAPNQYTAIANPDAVALRGVATNTATVTVNGNAALSDSIASDTVPWHYALLADNATGGAYSFAEIMAVVNPPGTNTPDLVSTTNGSVYAPPQAETLAYDDDGNLLNDGRFTYTWNGENRLIKAEELISPTNRQPHVVEYTYDHRGRMIWKTVASSNAPTSKTMRYLWDDYNIIAEAVVENNATNTTYNIWGLDLDGTLQGAGGVGGLLAVVKDTSTYIPAWDANGNIMEYVDSDGTVVANREYDPFGGTVVVAGDANAFTHWFSTKPWCVVTGLSEYQYRKFSSVLGRWLSRDPIEEVGGPYIYSSHRNSLIINIDAFGLVDLSPTSSFDQWHQAYLKWLTGETIIIEPLYLLIFYLSGKIGGDPWLNPFLYQYFKFDGTIPMVLSASQVGEMQTIPYLFDVRDEDPLILLTSKVIPETKSKRLFGVSATGLGNSTIGQFEVYYRGEVCLGKFVGEYRIDDTFNFDWKPFTKKGEMGRPPLAELLLRAFSLTVNGMPFKVISEWIPITDEAYIPQ